MVVRIVCSVAALFCVLPIRHTLADEPVSFSRRILPILSEKCFVCHGPDAAEIDADMLRLDVEAGATAERGGHRAIDRNEPLQSRLLIRIRSADDPMPPADAEKQLTDEERSLLEQWVREGAPYSEHWAFVPPKRSAVPGDHSLTGAAAVDAFIRAQLDDNGVTFAPEAEPIVLARRAALLLTGLPPEPEQLRRFLSDDRGDSWSRYLDELMQSPRYGEHQARYWLDAVRYGDTHGLHLDNRRGIYPYRDWVVRAFNRNMPFDEFLTWQIAGDLLPQPTLEQRVATGFVRMNPTTSEGGAIPAEFQAKNNFDRTETLGTVLLGMTLTCARCHTHKYDPITQTEYYRLLAFFNSTAESSMDGNKYEYGPVVKAPADHAAWTRFDSLMAERSRLLEQAASLISDGVISDPDRVAEFQEADATQQLSQIADAAGPFAASPLHEAAVSMVTQLAEAEKQFTTTLVAQELPQPRPTHVLRRGEYNLPVGDPLQPDVPSVMGSLPEESPRNRAGLAKWLTSRSHPLTARVLVNRMWQQIFGHGLVRTPEDFGVQGRHPTHPELLDWLAVEFQESGWNVQHMLRLMMSTRTFRQSSAWRPDIDDPENLLFARAAGYRLEAEVVRDIGLWASGLLDPHMGGEGVKPYQPDGMWKAMAHPASNTKSYERDSGSRLYRRSLYVYWKRTSPHPMMTLFDAPDRESSCVRRSRTNTSLQSLALLNETQRIEMSRCLAERLLREQPNDNDRIRFLYRLLTCREPSAKELDVCLSLLQTQRTRFQMNPDDAADLLSVGERPRDTNLDAVEVAAWSQLMTTVLASDAVLTLY